MTSGHPPQPERCWRPLREPDFNLDAVRVGCQQPNGRGIRIVRSCCPATMRLVQTVLSWFAAVEDQGG